VSSVPALPLDRSRAFPSRATLRRVAVLAVGALAIAGLQARASADAYRRASAMVRGDGALAPGADRARYDAAIGSGDGARRNAYVAAGASAALAVTAALLGYLSGVPATPPAAGVRF
jgi:hypothetical protein